MTGPERTVVDRLLDPDDPITPVEAAAEIRKLWDEIVELRLQLSREKSFYLVVVGQNDAAWKQVRKLRLQLQKAGLREEEDE